MAATVRSVTVRLNADVAGYIRDMKAAGAATDSAFERSAKGLTSTTTGLAGADRQLKAVDSSAGSASRSVSTLGSNVATLDRNVAQVNRSLRSGRNELDSFSGRARLITEAAVIGGPSLVALAAIGVPAVAGVASALGLAGAATGVVIAGFQGVGDTLEAVNKAQLEPTAENLAAAQAALESLSPAARGIVADLDELGPALTQLRDASATGFAPGFSEAADSLQVVLPRLRGFFYETAEAAGELVASSAESLTTERWAPFIRFLETEAPRAVTSLGSTAGDLARGLSELWMAFDPLNDDVLGLLERGADGFDRWAEGLDSTQGFQDFVEYIPNVAPQAGETLVALGDGLLQVGEALAPLAGPGLAALEGFGNLVGSIADSDLGTPIFGMAAGLLAVNRALKITQGIAASPVGGLLGLGGTAAAGGAAASGGLFGVAGDKARAAVPAVRQFGNALAFAAYSNDTLAKSAASSSAKVSESAKQAIAARAAVSGYAGTAARVAGPVAGLAVATTGLGDSLGLTNTASLGLMGTLGGPWGVAVGAAAGLLIDLSKMGDAADLSMSTLDTEVEAAGLNFGELASVMEVGETRARGYTDSLSLLEKGWAGWDGILTGSSSINTVNEDFLAQEQAAKDLEDGYRALAMGMGDVQGSVEDFTLDELTASAARAQPALEDLGYTAAELENLSPAEMIQVGMEVRQWGIYAESAAGRTEAFADAVRGLSNDALPAVEVASQMEAALGSLLGPTLNAEAATDQWRVTLMGLEKNLKSGAGFAGFTKAAIANRAMTREYTADSIERLTTLAGKTSTTEAQMAAAVRETRAEFIASGIAAGFSREAITKRANAMGLTPKMVRTVFEAAGIEKADLQIRQAKASLKSLPKRVQTRIENQGIPESMGEINRLTRRLDLTEKERRALITLKDLASKGLEIVNGKLRVIDKDRAEPVVDLNDAPFRAVERAVNAGIRALDGKRPTPTAGMNDNPFQSALNGVMAALGRADSATATPTVTANTGAAQSAIQAVIGALGNVQSKTVTVTVRRVMTGIGNLMPFGFDSAEGNMFPSVRAFANGGTDRRDQHLPEFAGPGPTRVWREPETQGESYIPWADDYRRPRAKAIAEQTVALFGGEVEWYADGGMRGDQGPDRRGVRGDDVGRSARDAGKGLRSLTARLKDAEKAVEAERKQREKITNTRSQVVSSSRDLFRSDLFGSSDNPWASMSPFGTLQADIAGAREYRDLVKRLKRMGLDDDALAAGAQTLESARYLAGLGKAGVREFETLYDRRDRVSAVAGRTAGNSAAYGDEVRQQTRELKEANQRLDRLEKAVKEADKNNQDGHAGSGDRTARALDGGANKARRRASGPGGRP